MMRAVILDDNVQFTKLLAEKISLIANKINFEIELNIAQNATEILDNPFSYDIYFMDIQMPGLSGIDVVKLLREKGIESEVVFVSSYDVFMQQSMFVKPRAFVRKEKLDDDLLRTMEVIKSVFDKKQSYIYIMNGKQKQKIHPSRIAFCKNGEHYVDIYYSDKEKLTIRIKLSELQEKLEGFDFIRTHSRYLVNTSYIKTIKRQEVTLINEEKVPISRGYQGQITEYMMKNIERL